MLHVVCILAVDSLKHFTHKTKEAKFYCGVLEVFIGNEFLQWKWKSLIVFLGNEKYCIVLGDDFCYDSVLNSFWIIIIFMC